MEEYLKDFNGRIRTCRDSTIKFENQMIKFTTLSLFDWFISHYMSVSLYTSKTSEGKY